MGVLLVVVGVLLLGLPLLALLADRVLPPPRNRPVPADPEDELRRRFSLSAAEHDEVARAVSRGRAAPDPLRPAAVALAEHVLRPATFRGRTVPRWVLPVAAVALVGYAVALGLVGGGVYAVIAVVVPAGQLVGPLIRRTRARRALTANRDGVPAGG